MEQNSGDINVQKFLQVLHSGQDDDDIDGGALIDEMKQRFGIQTKNQAVDSIIKLVQGTRNPELLYVWLQRLASIGVIPYEASDIRIFGATDFHSFTSVVQGSIQHHFSDESGVVEYDWNKYPVSFKTFAPQMLSIEGMKIFMAETIFVRYKPEWSSTILAPGAILCELPFHIVHDMQDNIPVSKCFVINMEHFYQGIVGLASKEAPALEINQGIFLDLMPNYGHFLLDNISRLFAISNSKFKRHNIYCRPLLDYHREIIDFLGFGDMSFIEIDIPSNSLIKFSNSYFVSQPSQVQSIGLIRRRLETLLGPSYSVPTLKVYLSRRGLPPEKRRIVNEKEIEDALIKEGFIILHTENMSVISIVKIMREAKVVVSGTGAQTINIIFCRPGVRYIHLVNKSFIGPRDIWWDYNWQCLVYAGVDYDQVVSKCEAGHENSPIDQICEFEVSEVVSAVRCGF